MARRLARLVALAWLAAAPAAAQEIDEDMDHAEGGCVYDRRVYPQNAELCQDGALMRCDAGSWDEIGACEGGVGRAPISDGGDTTDADD